MSNITSHTYPLLEESPWPLFGVFVLILIILVTAFSWAILNSDREPDLEEPDLEELELEELVLELKKLEISLELKDLEIVALERLAGELTDQLGLRRKGTGKIRRQLYLVERAIVRKKAQQS